MANKSIQLSDGTNNLYPYIPPITTDYSSSVSATYWARHLVKAYMWKSLKLGILRFNIDATSSCPVGSWVTMFTLSTGSRPVEDMYFILPTQGGTSTGVLLQVLANGNVQIYYPIENHAFIRGTITFPLA